VRRSFLDAAEKWAWFIRYCNNATFHSRHSATGDGRQRPLCADFVAEIGIPTAREGWCDF
jgi:hypothetical protein